MLFFIGCETNKSEEHLGLWVMNKEHKKDSFTSDLKVMFRKFVPYDYSEKIYVDNKYIEYPLGFFDEKNPLKSNFIKYSKVGNTITVQNDELTLSGEKLCLANSCFINTKNNTFQLSYLRLTIFFNEEISLDLEISEEGVFNISQSRCKEKKILLQKEEWDYLKKVCERININNLQKVYNQNTFDTRVYELLIESNGKRYKTNFNGLEEQTPFEVKASIINIMKFVDLYCIVGTS